jgi:hypothetical protein
MNRLRAGYVAIDPGLEPYLITGFTDDGPGVLRTYALGFPRTAYNQVLASAIFFSCVVNGLAAGGWVGILVGPATGTGLAIAAGAVVGLAYLGAFLHSISRHFARAESMPDLVRFPSPTVHQD